MKHRLVILFVLWLNFGNGLCEAESEAGDSLDNGFGRNIEWKKLSEAANNRRDKPAMVIFHKSWCKACHGLKKQFSSSKEIEHLSREFTMVNTDDEKESQKPEHDVDGKYVPRIIFFSQNGIVIQDVYNSKRKDKKYFYSKPEDVLNSMEKVLELQKESLKSPGRGFGDNIKWLTFPDGEIQSKKSGKPMMLLIHKTWCGSCKILKPKFANSKEIMELSKNFVMVNTEDDEEPQDSKFVIDGAYIPRIFFMESSGRVMDEVWNEGTNFPHVKYYYGEPEPIIRSMKIVIEKENNASHLENGWGKGIKWESLESGKKIYKQKNIPMLLVVHKSWCKACKVLRSYVSKSEELAELSANFVMVNHEDDKEELGAEYDIDGAYAPRLYFFDPQTDKVMEQFSNEDPAYKDDFKYSYGNDKQVVKVMKNVIEKRKTVMNDLSRGFGDNIKWTSLNESLKAAEKSHKPIMMIFHRTWCQFSQVLKEEFAVSLEIEGISKHFIMVNVEDDGIPDDQKYNLDGTYVPRILFLDSSGSVDETIMNENRREKKSKYFYRDGIDVVASMKVTLEKYPQTGLDRGFGRNIDWVNMDDALEEAKLKGKPIFMVIHKTWCGACHALKNMFNSSEEITKYSKHFVMVNLEDDEEPQEKQYDVDGKYFPRVFVLDPHGVVQRDLHNVNPDYLEYKFSYGTERNIIKTMNDALEKFKKDESNDHGFGENINWVGYTEGVEESKISGKPMLLIIHKTWCSACKALKRKISISKTFEELSKQFVMVNSQDDEEPDDELFDIDGDYVPRTFFIDSSGEIMADIYNTEVVYKESKYYYWDVETLVKSMERALDKSKMHAKKDEL